MTIMTLNNQILVLNTVSAHNELLAAVGDTFKWFEDATAGGEAVEDIEAKLTEVDKQVAQIKGLHETMGNEWKAFGKALNTAYANFGRDVVHRLGVDEKAHVRNFARNAAAGAFTRIRESARAYMQRTLEGIRD